MIFHLIFVYTYLLYGISLIIRNIEVPILYLFLLLFCCFKVTTNYRVCSVAYLECKLRKIKREQSIMNQFLDPIVDLRYTDHIYPLVILSYFILIYNFIYLKRYNDFKKLI